MTLESKVKVKFTKITSVRLWRSDSPEAWS